MANDARKLLVVDLDETLVFVSEHPIGRAADFRAFQYHVYRRPHLDAFLRKVAEHFALAVWSSASDRYVDHVVANIWPEDIPLEFVWGRSRATLRRVITDEHFSGDPSNHLNYRKPLAKLKRIGWQLEHVIIVDDTPSKSAQNYGNAVYPREWDGREEDEELLLLARYLPTLATVPNVRRVEKRNWRAKAQELG